MSSLNALTQESNRNLKISMMLEFVNKNQRYHEQIEGVSDPEDTAHQSAEIRAKLTMIFISAIIRDELIKACTESNVSSKLLIDELNQITMELYGNSFYRVSHRETEQLIRLLKACGVDPVDLDVIAETENLRLEGGESDPHHRYPQSSGEVVDSTKKPGRPRGRRKRQEKGTA